MPGSPGNSFIPIPGSSMTRTVDTFDGVQTMGPDQRYTLTEQLVANIAGPGVVASGVIPPTGVRLVLLGVSVSWPALATGVQLRLAATTAGSGLLSTSDLALGTYAPVTADMWLAAGSPEGTLPSLVGSDWRIATAEGNGSSPVYQVQIVALTPPDEVTLTVHYAPIYATKPTC